MAAPNRQISKSLREHCIPAWGAFLRGSLSSAFQSQRSARQLLVEPIPVVMIALGYCQAATCVNLTTGTHWIYRWMSLDLNIDSISQFGCLTPFSPERMGALSNEHDHDRSDYGDITADPYRTSTLKNYEQLFRSRVPIRRSSF